MTSTNTNGMEHRFMGAEKKAQLMQYLPKVVFSIDITIV